MALALNKYKDRRSRLDSFVIVIVNIITTNIILTTTSSSSSRRLARTAIRYQLSLSPSPELHEELGMQGLFHPWNNSQVLVHA